MTSSTESQKNSVCEYDQNVAILRDLPLFREVPTQSIQALAYLCKRMRYKQGEVLFTQNEEDHQAYYFLEGKAELVYKDEHGETLVGHYEVGDFIGGMSLLADVRRIFTLRAVEDVACIVLSRRKIPSDPEKLGTFMLAFGRALTTSIVEWEQRHIQEAQQAGLDIAKSLRMGVSLV